MRPRTRMSSRSRALLLLPLLCSGLGAVPAQAQSIELGGVPTAWRLQDYNNGQVTLFFTGSSCPSGRLDLLASASNESKNRLWATVMTGKIARQPVGVHYHVSGGQCVIDDFFLRETA